MSERWLICAALALLCHAALLFGFRIGSAPVPLPMSETAVEVSLVTAAIPEPPAAPAPPEPEPLPPEPELEPPKPEPIPEPTREPAPPRREPPKPSHAPSEPRRSTAPTGTATSVGTTTTRIAGPTTGARPRFNPKPIYPPDARQQRQQGRVIVGVQVSAEGRATSVSLVRGSGFPRLDAAAVEGVRRWTFAPAQAAGLAIPSRVEVPVTFSLSQ